MAIYARSFIFGILCRLLFCWGVASLIICWVAGAYCIGGGYHSSDHSHFLMDCYGSDWRFGTVWRKGICVGPGISGAGGFGSGSGRRTFASGRHRAALLLALLVCGDIHPNPGPPVQGAAPCVVVGDVVFAKMRGYCAWPAVVTGIQGGKASVTFYGTMETGVLAVKNVVPYIANREALCKAKSKGFAAALREADAVVGLPLGIVSRKDRCSTCRRFLRAQDSRARCIACGCICHSACMDRLEMGLVCSGCSVCALSDSFFGDSGSEATEDETATGDTIDWQGLGEVKGLRFGHLNINSLAGKYDEIHGLLTDGIFDVLALSETKLDPSFPDSQFQHPDYRMVRRDRQNGRGGGGLVVYLRTGLKALRRRAIEDDQIECLCIEIAHRTSPVMLIVAYRSPTLNPPLPFLDRLGSVLDGAMRYRFECLIMGDLNMNMAGEHPDRHLLEFMGNYALQMPIREATRPVSGTLIDVALSNCWRHYQGCGVVDPGLSDHCLIYVVRKARMEKEQLPVAEYRSSRNLDVGQFLGDLARRNWANCYRHANSDAVLDDWMANFNQVVDQHMPLKRVQRRAEHLPWIGPEIRRAIARRNRLSRRYLLNRTDENLRARNVQRNLVTKLKREAKRAYFLNVCEGGAVSPGQFWARMKPVLPSAKVKSPISCIQHQGQVISEKREIAEVLNDHFVKAASGAAGGIVDQHASLDCIRESWADGSFDFRLCTPAQIQSILRDLKQRRSGGIDGVSAKVLKLASPVLASEIANLCNCLIARGHFPSQWKLGVVAAIPKAGDATEVTNYRPVTLLSILSKVIERVLFNQLSGYFAPMLGSQLSGFRKGHSCTTALLKMTEDWRWALDRGDSVAVVAVDLSKAFDSIDHGLLLAKLEAYGVQPRSVRLLGSYLSQRQQCVRLGPVTSDWKTVERGVPQGSLLGPLFFNIFINDVTKCAPGVSMRLYADDTTIYCADRDPAALEFRTNTGLKAVCDWFGANGLQVNARKTQAMVLGNKGRYDLDLRIGGDRIAEAETLKLLGFMLDSRLSGRHQVHEAVLKATRKTGALNRVKRMVPERTINLLYKAFVLPHLEYCSPLLMTCDGPLTGKLERAQERTIRTLLRVPRDHSYDQALSRVKLKRLSHRRAEQALILVFKAVHGTGASYINEMFVLRDIGRDLRGNCVLRVPRPARELGRRSFACRAGGLWNGLPNNVRAIGMGTKFKAALSELELGV